MKKPDLQKFVVVEGSTVVGSFVTLRDALEFRTRTASRSARIVADHGRSDLAPPSKAARHDVSTRQLLED